jgi:hypothetical protein
MKLSNTEQLEVTCTLNVENNQLETDAHPLRRGMGFTFCQEVGRWTSSGIVPVLT